MNTFDHAIQKGEVWIRDMMRELDTDDPHQAYRALGAALQTLRDRLSVDEAAQVSAQLPLLVRGLFFEGWHPASTPVQARRPDDVIALFRQKSGDGHSLDAERALAAMFDVLRRHLSRGTLESLAHVLPGCLADLAH